VRECAVFAPGGVTSPVTMNNLWINDTKATVTQLAENDREITVQKIDDD
jgi:hypothetical protein